MHRIGPNPNDRPQASVLESVLGVLKHHEPAYVIIPERGVAGCHLYGVGLL
ncbi:MAG: hypothetical protein PHO08_12665 [Methylococcales bacterium]|nr:hypothetical protein [Methylococcales bacterium]